MDTTRSYVHTPGNFQYYYQTVPERMEMHAKRQGDKEVYVFLDPDGTRVSVTARRLYELSVSLAKSLVNRGVKKGDIVAIALANDLDCLVSILGAICAGAIALNVIIKNDDGSDVRELLIKSGATVLILKPGKLELNACMNFIDEIKSDGQVKCSSVPTLKLLVSTEPVENLPLLQLDGLLQNQCDCELPSLDPDDPIVVFTTSGSTGAPKLVLQSHHAAMICGFHLKESMLWDADTDVIYCERRLVWIGGFPYMYLHDAVKVVTKTLPIATLMDHCNFTLDSIEKEGCTIAAILPATVVGCLDCDRKPKKLLKNINTGGWPVAAICMNAIGTITERVSAMYGSSEMGFCSAQHVLDKESFLNHSSGPPLRGVEIKVCDEDGQIVKRGQMGRLFVRSPALFWNYLNDEAHTKAALSPSHWMDTDDMGYIDNAGHVVVDGRCSEIIMQSGRLIMPSGIEALIRNHPDVSDVVVVSVPDEAKFVLLTACIIPKPGRPLTSDDMLEFFKAKHLASANEAFSHSWPELIFIFDEFPKLYTGKVDKKKTRLEAIRRASELKL